MHLFNSNSKGSSYTPVKNQKLPIDDLDELGFKEQNYKSHLAAEGANRSNRSYQLIFRLIHVPLPGKRICILGRIPELSNWDKSQPKCFLKNTT